MPRGNANTPAEARIARAGATSGAPAVFPGAPGRAWDAVPHTPDQEGARTVDELTVIGAENGALIVVAADGARFRVPITEALHTALRQNRPPSPSPHRVGPREVQALIRRGLTAAEVAAQTGEQVEYIQRFEGPVLAEREYVVTAARSVPVAVAADVEPGTTGTFGSVIDRRLDALGAREVRWESRKTETLWQVTVSFLDGETARTATWTFDPKRSVLAPLDHEARSLSQQGESGAPVLPRLRAVPAEATGARFDSGAFAPLPSDEQSDARTEAPGAVTDGGNTADLLEALRRRRGEREPASTEEWESARAAHPSTGSIRIVEIPLDTTDTDDPQLGDTVEVPSARSGETVAHDSEIDDASLAPAADPAPQAATPKSTSRRGRAAMPSWDEIVFGARPDDDPA